MLLHAMGVAYNLKTVFIIRPIGLLEYVELGYRAYS